MRPRELRQDNVAPDFEPRLNRRFRNFVRLPLIAAVLALPPIAVAIRSGELSWGGEALITGLLIAHAILVVSLVGESYVLRLWLRDEVRRPPEFDMRLSSSEEPTDQPNAQLMRAVSKRKALAGSHVSVESIIVHRNADRR